MNIWIKFGCFKKSINLQTNPNPLLSITIEKCRLTEGSSLKLKLFATLKQTECMFFTTQIRLYSYTYKSYSVLLTLKMQLLKF